jgi:ubiquinone/menaquinone biosynthesis C-methylase UbiE
MDPRVRRTIDFYNKNAKPYSNRISNRFIPKLINRFSDLVEKGEKVLDVGCAAGRDSRHLKNKGFKVVGIDLSDELLNLAREKDKESIYLRMNATDIDFGGDEFGGIFASAVLLHLPSNRQVEKAIGEFYRVMKPGGVLFISVKAETFGKPKEEMVIEHLSLGKARYMRYFNKNELAVTLVKQGFEVIDIEKIKSRSRNLEWIQVFAKKPD